MFAVVGVRACLMRACGVFALTAAAAAVTGMAAEQMGFVGTNMFMMAFTSYFFEGFVLVRVPFPLTNRFKVRTAWYGMIWYGMVWYGTVWCAVYGVRYIYGICGPFFSVWLSAVVGDVASVSLGSFLFLVHDDFLADVFW